MPKFLSGRNMPQWDSGPKLPPFQENERVQADETLDGATGTVIEAGLRTSRVAFDDEDLEPLQHLELSNNSLTSLGKHCPRDAQRASSKQTEKRSSLLSREKR